MLRQPTAAGLATVNKLITWPGRRGFRNVVASVYRRVPEVGLPITMSGVLPFQGVGVGFV